MAEFLAACRACTRIGVKTDHYAPDRLSCFNCCTDGARRKGSSTAKHGMHTLHVRPPGAARAAASSLHAALATSVCCGLHSLFSRD